MIRRYLERQEHVAKNEGMDDKDLVLEYYLLECEFAGDPDLVRIPAYPDGYSGIIRTVNRKHPDTLSMI